MLGTLGICQSLDTFAIPVPDPRTERRVCKALPAQLPRRKCSVVRVGLEPMLSHDVPRMRPCSWSFLCLQQGEVAITSCCGLISKVPRLQTCRQHSQHSILPCGRGGRVISRLDRPDQTRLGSSGRRFTMQALSSLASCSGDCAHSCFYDCRQGAFRAAAHVKLGDGRNWWQSATPSVEGAEIPMRPCHVRKRKRLTVIELMEGISRA